ncbi:MAG: hypothetical protein ACFFAM_08580 [Promethearchaeota archaeon]
MSVEKDQCAICGSEATMSLSNTGESYCISCFNQVMNNPVLRRQRANIGRGGERRLVRNGLTIELIDEAVAKKRKNIPRNYILFRSEEFNIEFYYPDDWILNPEIPMALLAIFAPRNILKGKFKANLTVGVRDLSGININKDRYTQTDVENLKRLLTNQGVQKFKMKEIKNVKVAERPAHRLIYGGRTESMGMKFDLMWVNYTTLIKSIEYIFTLTSDKKDHKLLLNILEKIIETVKLIE